MKDTQLKKLARVVRKLAAEVASLRKLIRRELLAKGGDGARGGEKRVGNKKRKKKKTDADGQPHAGPPAA